MKYISHVPLIGGFTIGAMNVTGVPPVSVTSYSAFDFNDSLLMRYLNETKNLNVPRVRLDKDEIPIYKNIDFVHATPPCSALSQYATREKGSRGTAAPNEWMYKSAEYIFEHIQPKVYIFENAPGLYTSVGDQVRDKLIDICNKYNYSITFYKTNTLYHGVPQNRPRTYAICYKGSHAPILEYYNKPYKNVANFLKEIPKKASLQNEYFADEWNVANYEVVEFFKQTIGPNWRNVLLESKEHIGIYDYLKRTNTLKVYQKWLLKNYPNNEKTIKALNHVIKKTDLGKNFRVSYKAGFLDKEYVYAVIGGMMECAIHPYEDRLYNMREHMYFMGMPHDFELYDKKEYAKLPQNCPVKTNEDMIKEVIAIVNGERQLSHTNVLMQDNTDKTKKDIKIKTLF